MPDSERFGDSAATVASDPQGAPARAPEDRKRARLLFALRFLLSAGLLAWLVAEIDGARVGDILSNIDGRWLVLAVVVILLGRVLVTFRWYLLVRERASHVSFAHLLRIVLISGFVGAVVPGAVGIELYRMYALGRGTTLALGVSSVVVERLSALVGLVVMVSFGLAWATVDGSLALPRAVLLATGVSILCVVAIAVVVVDRRLRRFMLYVLEQVLGPTVPNKLHRVFAHIDAFHDDRRLLLTMMGLALVLQALRVLEIVAIAMALDIHAPLSAFFVIVPIGILVGLVPISIQGLGVREALYVTLFAGFGVGTAAAFTLSIFNFALSFAMFVVPGAILFALGGLAERPGRPMFAAARTSSRKREA